MKRTNASALVAVCAALTLTACSSGGGGGIGGSGIVAQGAITELDGIKVNGIRFDTAMASISVDEKSAAESDLKLGMIVTVLGTLDDDGVTAVADAVIYDDSLEGPVGAITTDADGDSHTLTILGVAVVGDRTTTVYEGVDFDGLAALDVVRVSGLRDADGRLIATRIEKTGVFDANNPGATEIEISGPIAGLAGNSFTIGTLSVNFDGNTDLPGESLMDGLLVEVEGVLENAAGTSAFAFEIKLEDDGLPDDADEFEIEGVVTDFVSLDDFRVAGVAVNAADADFEPSSLATSIGDASLVEVEGELRDGVLLADEVQGRGGDVRIQAYVITTAAAAKTIDLGIAPNGVMLTVSTGADTKFKDELSEDPFDHAAIGTDDYLRVRGFLDGSDIVASEIKRTEGEDKIVVQGTVEARSYEPPNGTITVLGTAFATDAGTEFQRDGDSDDPLIADPADFFNDLAVTGMSAVVKLIDEVMAGTLGDGTLDEVEIEHDGEDSDSGDDSDDDDDD